jgi:hypothetical protein
MKQYCVQPGVGPKGPALARFPRHQKKIMKQYPLIRYKQEKNYKPVLFFHKE